MERCSEVTIVLPYCSHSRDEFTAGDETNKNGKGKLRLQIPVKEKGVVMLLAIANHHAVLLRGCLSLLGTVASSVAKLILSQSWCLCVSVVVLQYLVDGFHSVSCLTRAKGVSGWTENTGWRTRCQGGNPALLHTRT